MIEQQNYHHPHQKQVINRMARIVGHAQAIKRMLEEEKECSEVLIQIAAVKSALNNVGKIILKDHINHCVVDAFEKEKKDVLEELDKAIEVFVK